MKREKKKEEILNKMAKQAMRTIALAYKDIPL